MSHGHHHHEHGEHQRDRYGNPAELADYLQKLEGEDRAAWQKPDEVVAALGLRQGDVACEIGAGPGYFSMRLARAVGERGRVFAVEANPRILEVLRDRIEAAHLTNLTPVFALPGDPLLPDGSCDLALIVNTFHHLKDGADYLRRIVRALKRGGRIANLDFIDAETPVGPPVQMRVPRDEFLRVAKQAGLALEADHSKLLEYQYFLVLRPMK